MRILRGKDRIYIGQSSSQAMAKPPSPSNTSVLKRVGAHSFSQTGTPSHRIIVQVEFGLRTTRSSEPVFLPLGAWTQPAKLDGLFAKTIVVN